VIPYCAVNGIVSLDGFLKDRVESEEDEEGLDEEDEVIGSTKKTEWKSTPSSSSKKITFMHFGNLHKEGEKMSKVSVPVPLELIHAVTDTIVSPD
jgi:hypothetical protein